MDENSSVTSRREDFTSAKKDIEEDSDPASNSITSVSDYYYLQIILQSIIYCLFMFVLIHLTILIYQQWLKTGIFKWENILQTIVGFFFLFLLLLISYYLVFCHINTFVILLISKLSTLFESFLTSTSSSSTASLISERECYQLFQILDKEKKGYLMVSDLALMLDKTMKNDSKDQKAKTTPPFSSKSQILNFLDTMGCDGKGEKDGKIFYDEFRKIFLR
jgi:hypothetical protein